MPRLNMRPLLILATFLLFYHWAFGFPLWPRGQAKQPAQLTFQQKMQEIAHGLDIPWNKRVIAIGDLHGDLSHALKILRTASLVDDRGNWIGKDATLIQTGDIVDRGPDTIAIYKLFDSLRTQARSAGGEVVSLLGNHEFMNVMGDWRYVTKEDIETFHGDTARRRAFSSGWIGQTFLANYSVAAQVTYSPPLPTALEGTLEPRAVVAVHGGIHPSWANITRINEVGHRLLHRLIEAGIPNPMSIPRDTPYDERDLYSATGPLWYRGYALDSEEDGICDQAGKVLKTLGATHMIMGHTPQFKGIWSRCNSKIIVIDTGISKAYGGPLSALEIHYSLTPSSDDTGGATKASAIVEREVITALYEHSKQVLVRKERTINVAVSLQEAPVAV